MGFTSSGSGPSAIAVNPLTNKIYVANSGDGTVSVIDSNSGKAAKKIYTGANPSSIAVDDLNNRIYVANQFSGSVSVIDGYT